MGLMNSKFIFADIVLVSFSIVNTLPFTISTTSVDPLYLELISFNIPEMLPSPVLFQTVWAAHWPES